MFLRFFLPPSDALFAHPRQLIGSFGMEACGRQVTIKGESLLEGQWVHFLVNTYGEDGSEKYKSYELWRKRNSEDQ